MPIFWKSKLIKKIYKSPKDAETVNLSILADVSRHTANQVDQLLFGKIIREGDTSSIKVKLFTDSLGSLESVTSTHQVERRMMRSDIADLKQKLETREIFSRYCWLQDKNILADILTKERKEKFGLDNLLKENKLSVLKTEDNCVKCEEGEIMITRRNLRDKLTPKKKVPFRTATTSKVSKSLPS